MAPINPYAYCLRKRFLATPRRELKLAAIRQKWPSYIEAGREREFNSSSAKLPRPPGEGGRPGRGGFTLKTSLEWPSERYQRAQRVVREVAKRKLDIGKPFTEQSEEALAETYQEIVACFPEINKYDQQWPATELVKAFLKNTPRNRTRP